jgi:hypothetical protein
LSPSALSRAIKRIEERWEKPCSSAITGGFAHQAGELFHLYAREAFRAIAPFRKPGSRDGVMRGEVESRVRSRRVAEFSANCSPLPSGYPKVSVSVLLEDEQKAFSLVTRDSPTSRSCSPCRITCRKRTHRRHRRDAVVFIAPAKNCQTNELAAQEPRNWAELPLVLDGIGPLAAKTGRMAERTRHQAENRGAGLPLRGRPALVSFAAESASCRDPSGPSRLPRTPRARICPEAVGFNYGFAALKRRLLHPVVRVFWETATMDRSRLVHSTL